MKQNTIIKISGVLMRLCLCTLLLVVAEARAQLTVDDFSRRIDDMSARSTEIDKKLKIDANGDLCALIKVFAPRTEGFTFYGGAQSGYLSPIIHGGEIWLFVPASAQRISISHAEFGQLENWEYPIALEQGATYQMLLNVGGGRFVNISSSNALARISINGKFIGETPIFNRYMPYGKYVATAVKDRFEGVAELEVVKAGEGDDHQQSFFIPMIDQTPHYGDVTITVKDDPNAEIFYKEERVGAGTWKTMLKEGQHEIITKKADCDSALTRFIVTSQTQNNITVNAPVPHTGNVLIYTRPRSAKATYDGKHEIDLTEQRALPVGTHQFLFTKTDYENLQKDIVVKRGETVIDTLELAMTNYIKNKWGFYFGTGYTITSLSGITGYIGGVIENVDLQLSYTLGLKKSDNVYVYTYDAATGHELQSTNQYKMNAMAVRLGYQFRPIPRLGLTPQLGFMQQMLTAKNTGGSGKFADGARASSLTLGLKVLGVPVKHLYLFLTPEYALPLKRDNTFKQMAKAADFSAGGFSVSAGFLVNFGNK